MSAEPSFPAPSEALPEVSIVIPVFNKLAFTRQCLDRIWRHTETVPYEILVVDNGSVDGTEAYFTRPDGPRPHVRYHRNPTNLGFAKANNLGARLARRRDLLFLNNDTLVTPGWLEAMLDLARSDPRIGIVGLKQLFPYTSRIHHTGIIFTAGRVPQHLYPHADARLPHVNREREYQAVTGACLLVGRELFLDCGGFDERYLNGYEDIDLCFAVRRRGFRVVCCTRALIYHYGQITEGRAADDDQNAAHFTSKWKGEIRVDEGDYLRRDAEDLRRAEVTRPARPARRPETRAFHFVDELAAGSALVWAVADLALALKRLGVPVHVPAGPLTDSLSREARGELEALMTDRPDPDGVQLKWSHYWPQHLGRDLTGTINFELFVINYRFAATTREPWDYWLQCLRQNHYEKLPVTGFCRDVLLQVGVSGAECHVFPLGYSPEVHEVGPRRRNDGVFRFLTVTNSHDLERYGTRLLLDAYWEAFDATDDVVLVVKDYGPASGDTTLWDLIRGTAARARVEYLAQFTSKRELIALYRSCDAFVSAHRGEGFGMKLLDALACGLPVITPLFGGPTEFCTPANSLPVAFTLAPMGDCLDTRSLRIANQPTWCEPDRADLVRQLRFVREHPAEAAAVGQRAQSDVLDRFTWEQAARRLVEITDRIAASRPAVGRPVAVAAAPAQPVETSPYWLGCRVSVVIPTYNRKALLDKCLRALARQSVLPQEFEVLVVDDGSTDGTEAWLAGQTFPFPLRYHRQTNQGPGAARNLGITLAEGELILFIGDDIIAHQRLLETHLLAHAEHPEPEAAVLGHIDWPPWLPPTPVMTYACGKDTRQFAYGYIPHLPTLDYRFFYTSNISLKRRFLLDALAAGIRFDPCFRYAAFEDSEYGYRLQARGLTLRYRKDALVYHDHLMDLQSFARREAKVGEMAVVFYRKHPRIDELLRVRWVGDWTDAVERLGAQPELCERVQALDAQTDDLLRSLARSLEELVGLEVALTVDRSGSLTRDGVRARLDALYRRIFEVERTRGKVREWYRNVDDPRRLDAALALLPLAEKLDFLGGDLASLGAAGPEAAAAGEVRARVQQLEQALEIQVGRRTPEPAGTTAGGFMRWLGRRSDVRAALRRADLALQRGLGAAGDPRWVASYGRLRSLLKQRLNPP